MEGYYEIHNIPPTRDIMDLSACLNSTVQNHLIYKLIDTKRYERHPILAKNILNLNLNIATIQKVPFRQNILKLPRKKAMPMLITAI